MSVSIKDIRRAARQIKGHVLRTPFIRSDALSEMTGAEVVLKLENLQHTSSFKARGALVKLLSLSTAEKKAGIVAASAGNHAQGVAYHARNMGIPATIYMPEITPFTKIGRTECLGAHIELAGGDLSETQIHAKNYAYANGMAFVHPYDDPHIIAGQGTVGLEMLQDDVDLDALIIPIGGGGLIAGCAIAAKAVNPKIDIYGVEAMAYPSMKNAITGKKPKSGGQTIAEGIAVKNPGKLPLPVIEKLVSDILLVDEEALEKAVQVYLETQRLVVEGAGAASFAALMKNRKLFKGRKVGLVVSGGNIDSRLMSSILMRGLVKNGRMVRLRIAISDTPGALARVTGLIADCGGNIVEVYHQRMFQDIPVKQADLDAVVETRDASHVQEVIDCLNTAGFTTRRLGSTSNS